MQQIYIEILIKVTLYINKEILSLKISISKYK